MGTYRTLAGSLAAAIAVLAFGNLASAQAQGQFGSGVYRPFNLMRQLKLATAYFVNPSLPDRVEIYFAYPLKDAVALVDRDKVAASLASGALRLSIPLGDSTGYLTQVEPPCRRTGQAARNPPEQPACSLWLATLQDRKPIELRKFHVFSEADFRGDGSARVVTWDPHEVVSETRFVSVSLPTAEHGAWSQPAAPPEPEQGGG